MNRARVNGDPHGQAPLLWLCRELLQKKADSARIRVIAPVKPGELRLRRAVARVHD